MVYTPQVVCISQEEMMIGQLASGFDTLFSNKKNLCILCCLLVDRHIQKKASPRSAPQRWGVSTTFSSNPGAAGAGGVDLAEPQAPEAAVESWEVDPINMVIIPFLNNP